MRCNNCRNEQSFITEAYYLHWITVDQDWNVKSVSNLRQGDNDSHLDIPEHVHVQCAHCESQDIDFEY